MQIADPRIVVLSGLPGSGKSTVALRVAESRHRCAVVSGDAINDMIVSGRVWALGEPANEATRQVELCIRNMGMLARNFAAQGFDVVIEHVIPLASEIDDLATMLAPYACHLFVLDPGEAIAQQRNHGRNPQERVDYDAAALMSVMRQELGDRGRWLANAQMSAEATAALVLSG